MKQKVWFITGTSKGFGLEIAKAALANGDKVVATVRKRQREFVDELDNNDRMLVVQMDVTNEQDIKMSVEKAIACFGRIDVLVNNAGYGLVAATEEASDQERCRTKQEGSSGSKERSEEGADQGRPSQEGGSGKESRSQESSGRTKGRQEEGEACS